MMITFKANSDYQGPLSAIITSTIMLFKLTFPDMLNSALLSISMGKMQYAILTHTHFTHVMVPAWRSYFLDLKGQRFAVWGQTLCKQLMDIVIRQERLSSAKDLFGCMDPSSS
jgi:hypothetical protein